MRIVLGKFGNFKQIDIRFEDKKTHKSGVMPTKSSRPTNMKVILSFVVLISVLHSSVAGVVCSRLLKVVLQNDRVDELIPFDFNCRCDLRAILFFRPIKFECSTRLCSDDILNSELVSGSIPIDIPLINEPCITPTLSGTMDKLGGGDMTVGGCTGKTDVTVNVTAIVENIAAEYLDEILDQYLDELLELYISDYLNGGDSFSSGGSRLRKLSGLGRLVNRGDSFSSEGSRLRKLSDSGRTLEVNTRSLAECIIATLEDIIRCNITSLEQLLNQTDIVTLLNNTDLEDVLDNQDLIDSLVDILNGTDINDLLNGTDITDLINFDSSELELSDFINLTDVNIFDFFNISDIIPGLEEIMTYRVPDSCLSVDTRRDLLLEGTIQFFGCEISIGGKNCGCEVCGETNAGILFSEACFDLVLDILPEGLQDFVPFNFTSYCLDAGGMVSGRGAADVMLAPFTTFGFQ